jgi:NADH-quinone oxidoreductase subunit N
MRREHDNGENFNGHFLGKIKFFIIAASPDLLVDELFLRTAPGSLYENFFLLLPELTLCFGLFLILAHTGQSLAFLQTLTINIFRACSLSLLVTFGYLGKNDFAGGSFIFEGAYQFSLWSQCVKLFVLLLAIFFIVYFDLGDLVPNEFVKFLVIFILLAFILSSNRSFFLLLIALEGISLLAYITASAEKSYGGIAAAVKYFSIGALGSVLLLWSALHMYPVILQMSYQNVFMSARKYEVQNFEVLEIIEFFSTLLTFGVAVKLGVAPFHQWIADLYAGTSVFINAVFALLIKVIVFFSVFEILCNLLCDVLFKLTLIYSLILGCYFALRQNEVRRLIAYSSIVHTSFLLIGDAVVSITYMLTYICSNVLFFTSLLVYENEGGGTSTTWLNDLGNFNKYGYFNTSVFAISLFSMMGLPPFAGFFGKIMVWISLIEDFYFYNELYSYAFFILSVLLSIVIAFYYLRIVVYIFATRETSFIQLASPDNAATAGRLVKSKLVVQYFSLYFVIAWAFWHEDIITLVLFLITNLC